MTAQVSFVTDFDLKNRALEKARQAGITLKAFLTFAMKAFVEDKISLGIQSYQEEPEVEEVHFDDKGIHEKAAKLAKLLKHV